jgi:hypothetical protein
LKLTGTSKVLIISIIRAMMEAVSTSETLVNFYETWCNNPEDSHLHTHYRTNLKSHTVCTHHLMLLGD